MKEVWHVFKSMVLFERTGISRIIEILAGIILWILLILFILVVTNNIPKFLESQNKFPIGFGIYHNRR